MLGTSHCFEDSELPYRVKSRPLLSARRVERKYSARFDSRAVAPALRCGIHRRGKLRCRLVG